MCLIHIAEKKLSTKFDKISVIEECIKKGYVDFNENNYDDVNNFYVNRPDLVLKYLTGNIWEVRKEYPPYKKKSNEYVIEYWSANGGESGHFCMMEDGYTSLQKSNSVNNGKIHSYRVFRIIG